MTADEDLCWVKAECWPGHRSQWNSSDAALAYGSVSRPSRPLIRDISAAQWNTTLPECRACADIFSGKRSERERERERESEQARARERASKNERASNRETDPEKCPSMTLSVVNKHFHYWDILTYDTRHKTRHAHTHTPPHWSVSLPLILPELHMLTPQTYTPPHL